MPQVFKIGGYWVYFWTNENRSPLLAGIEKYVTMRATQ